MLYVARRDKIVFQQVVDLAPCAVDAFQFVCANDLIDNKATDECALGDEGEFGQSQRHLPLLTKDYLVENG